MRREGERLHRPSGAELDAALRRASADPRAAWTARGLAWLASAYNRAPLRVMLDVVDWPPFLLDGVIPSTGRGLAFLALRRARSAEHRAAARGTPPWSSGWAGSVVVLLVWSGIAALAVWALSAAGSEAP